MGNGMMIELKIIERRKGMDLTNVGREAFLALGLGAVLAFAIPLALALLWIFIKKEKFTTVLVGAATFLLFALILEKPLQALVISMDHPLSRFLNAHPVCWALVVGLFPGIFEETGRMVAFRTVLKDRKNRETSISYGIGHGGFEVMMVLGLNYVTYIFYALMINAGSFPDIINQVKAQEPDQVDALYTLANQLAHFTISDMGMGFLERAFALLFHIGVSMLVFYACKEKGRFHLYPIAILLHTAMDFIAGLAMVKVIHLPTLVIEGIFGAFGILTFCAAYFLLYRRDNDGGLTPNR